MELGQGDKRTIEARVNQIMETTRERIEQNSAGEDVDIQAEHAHAQTQMLAAGIDAVLQVRGQLDRFEKAVARQAIANQQMAAEVEATRKLAEDLGKRAAEREERLAEEMTSLRMEIESRSDQIRNSLDSASMAADRAAEAVRAAARSMRG